MVWIIYKNRNAFWIGQGRRFLLLFSYYIFIVTILASLYMSDWIIFVQVHKMRSIQLFYFLKFEEQHFNFLRNCWG